MTERRSDGWREAEGGRRREGESREYLFVRLFKTGILVQEFEQTKEISSMKPRYPLCYSYSC